MAILKAEITISIPREIVERLKECNLKPEEILKVFSSYMKEVINHPYGQFYNDFDVWLEGMDEEEFKQLYKS